MIPARLSVVSILAVFVGVTFLACAGFVVFADSPRGERHKPEGAPALPNTEVISRIKALCNGLNAADGARAREAGKELIALHRVMLQELLRPQ